MSMKHERTVKAFATLLSVVSLASAVGDIDIPTLHLDKDDDTYFDIRIPETVVPADLTTYVCYTEKIPVVAQDAYYAVAFDPLIVNSDVMHHMIMFGCNYSPSSASFSPHKCSGADNLCRAFVVQWSKGIKGPIRSPPNTGVKFGLGSFQFFSLQIHWNNAKFINGTTDSSGVRVYYTKQPREFPLGNLQVGQNNLEIPANEGRFAQRGSCSSDCTSRWLKEPIFLTRVHIHMHYLGVGGVLELLRGLETIQLVNDERYDYNSPPAHRFLKPVKVLPGDELRLTCFFNSRDGDRFRNRTVYWGEGSDGEMCYAFITYYPMVEHFDQCIQIDQYELCSESGVASVGECIFGGFIHSVNSGMAQEIINQCEKESNTSVCETGNINQTNEELRHGKSKRQSEGKHLCSEKCDIAVREVTEHPCMQDRLGSYAKRVYLPHTLHWARVKNILDQWERQC